jgi:RsiW-degrading membrane proteinase PrsW (M82 family)
MNEMSVEEAKLSESGATGEAHAHEEAAYWSDGAMRRLTQARLLGLLAVLIGASAYIMGKSQSTVIASLLSSSGLTLLAAGLIVIVAAARTRGLAPDQAFVPRPITHPRMWFVLTWGAGIAVAAFLLFLSLPEIVEQLIMLMLSLGLMLAGSVWALRWLSGQRVKFWPLNSELRLRWVPMWTVLWAGVWGVISTFLAIVIEAAPVLALALLSGSAFDEVPPTRLSSYESLARAIHNPALLVLIFAGAVIGAPLIEEAVKAVGLRGFRRWIQHPVDGWLLGFTVGLGFGLLEGAFNLDTTENWFLGGWVRLAALLLHGLATSLTGLGYARYLQTRRRSELWRGYGHAVIMHGLWNACALTIAFAGIAMGLSAFTLNVLLVCLVGALIIGLAVFMVLLIRRVARAGVQSSIQEDYQQAGVPLPNGWTPMKFNLGWRLVGRQPIVVPATVTAQPEVTPGSSSANPIDDPYLQHVEDDLRSE